MLTAFVGQAILLEASLSYLGMGVQEPTPAWGLMLQGGAEEYAESAPWVPIFPGLAITLAVFGFNLLGDGLRDVLDPRLRHPVARSRPAQRPPIRKRERGQTRFYSPTRRRASSAPATIAASFCRATSIPNGTSPLLSPAA